MQRKDVRGRGSGDSKGTEVAKRRLAWEIPDVFLCLRHIVGHQVLFVKLTLSARIATESPGVLNGLHSGGNSKGMSKRLPGDEG